MLGKVLPLSEEQGPSSSGTFHVLCHGLYIDWLHLTFFHSFTTMFMKAYQAGKRKVLLQEMFGKVLPLSEEQDGPSFSGTFHVLCHGLSTEWLHLTIFRSFMPIFMATH